MGREKRMELGATCGRVKIKSNKGEMGRKVAFIIQINEK